MRQWRIDGPRSTRPVSGGIEDIGRDGCPIAAGFHVEIAGDCARGRKGEKEIQQQGSHKLRRNEMGKEAAFNNRKEFHESLISPNPKRNRDSRNSPLLQCSVLKMAQRSKIVAAGVKWVCGSPLLAVLRAIQTSPIIFMAGQLGSCPGTKDRAGGMC